MTQLEDLPCTGNVGFGDDVRAMAPALAHSDEIRTTFAGFPAAVGALSARVDDTSVGLVATSLAVGISYAPPMVLFAVRNESATWPILRTSPRIGISVLAEDQDAICRQLAGPEGSRFAGLDTTVGTGGALFLDEASTWMECSIASSVPAGDHTVVTFDVHSVGHRRATTPLVFCNGAFPRLR